MNRLYH